MIALNISAARLPAVSSTYNGSLEAASRGIQCSEWQRIFIPVEMLFEECNSNGALLFPLKKMFFSFVSCVMQIESALVCHLQPFGYSPAVFCSSCTAVFPLCELPRISSVFKWAKLMRWRKVLSLFSFYSSATDFAHSILIHLLSSIISSSYWLSRQACLEKKSRAFISRHLWTEKLIRFAAQDLWAPDLISSSADPSSSRISAEAIKLIDHPEEELSSSDPLGSKKRFVLRVNQRTGSTFW